MGYGHNINTFMPYTPPLMTFGGLGSNWGSGSGTTSAAVAESDEEIKKKKIKEERAKAFLERMELIKKQAENAPKIQEQIKELVNSNKELTATIDKAKSGKETKDGTIKAKESWEDYTKLPWWKKTLRAGSQLVQGGWKAATSLVGYETDKKTGERKWNPVKLGVNAAIAVGCVALCACTAPVSLPLIGATTVGAAASGALLALGGGAAAYGIAKGTKNAITAKTTKDLDNAFQDIGEGITIGAATLAGARATGASLESTAASNSAAAIARTTNGGTYARVSNFLTRTEYIKGSNKFSQYFYDSTINAARSIAHSGSKGRMDFANNGILKSSWQNFKSFIPSNGKTKMDKAQNDLTQNIDARLAKIQQDLQEPNISSFNKALLKSEQKYLNAQKAEINSTTTRNAWKSLKTKSQSHKELEQLQTSIEELQNAGVTKINGKRFNTSEENVASLQQTQARVKQLSKQIENLVKVRQSTIKNMAYLKRYKAEVEAYTGKTRNSRFRRFFDVRKIQKEDITFGKVLLAPFKAAFWALGLELKPWTYIQKSPASTVFKTQEMIIPEYEEGFLTTGFLADALDMGEKTLKTKIVVQNENGENVEQEVEVTKELLAKLEEQKQQTEAAISEAQNQLGQLYVA